MKPENRVPCRPVGLHAALRPCVRLWSTAMVDVVVGSVPVNTLQVGPLVTTGTPCFARTPTLEVLVALLQMGRLVLTGTPCFARTPWCTRAPPPLPDRSVPNHAFPRLLRSHGGWWVRTPGLCAPSRCDTCAHPQVLLRAFVRELRGGPSGEIVVVT